MTNALPLPDTLPALSMVAPATVAAHRLDLARALAGGVVASLAAGDARGARVALDAVLDALAPFAAGLDGLVLHHAVSLPEDLEARFGLT
jgi:hypothetical protein